MDEQIIELTKRVAAEPKVGLTANELDLIIDKHATPWRSQIGTFWDSFKIIGILGLAFIVIVLVVPLLSGQGVTNPADTQPNSPEQIADNESEKNEEPAADTNSEDDIRLNANTPTPQPQDLNSTGSSESLASAISLIDSILAQPAEIFEVPELE